MSSGQGFLSLDPTTGLGRLAIEDVSPIDPRRTLVSEALTFRTVTSVGIVMLSGSVAQPTGFTLRLLDPTRSVASLTLDPRIRNSDKLPIRPAVMVNHDPTRSVAILTNHLIEPSSIHVKKVWGRVKVS